MGCSVPNRTALGKIIDAIEKGDSSELAECKALLGGDEKFRNEFFVEWGSRADEGLTAKIRSAMPDVFPTLGV